MTKFDTCPHFSVAQFNVENRLRAITMHISEVNLMSAKKESQNSAKQQLDHSKLGKSLCNGSINMRYSILFSSVCYNYNDH